MRAMKEKNELLVKKLRNARAERVNEQTERSEFEQLFVDCIEEVRKEVMRRRFRTEVANRKANNRTSKRALTTNTTSSPMDGNKVNSTATLGVISSNLSGGVVSD